MFERFTREARAVVAHAEEQGAALDAPAIGCEHLLLGVAAGEGAGARVLASLGLDHGALRAELERTGGALDADALAAVGIDLDQVRRRVEASFGPGALSGRRRGATRFTPKAKKALELGLREALALGDRSIAGEHLLLGLMRDPEDRVARLLDRRGRTPDAVRAATLAARSRAA